MPLRNRRSNVSNADVERDVTVLTKTFERPDCLRRLVSSIRRFYPAISIVVVDDSREPIEPVPDGIRYWHFPLNTLGVSGGRNFGLRQVETEFVLISDDDMVFGRRTDLRRMLDALRTTRLDLVSCKTMNHYPEDIALRASVRRGVWHFEGSLDVVDGRLVQHASVRTAMVDGLPVFDVVPQFFLASRERLGDDPWDDRLPGPYEHTDFFLTLKARGVLSSQLSDVTVYHYPQSGDPYWSYRQPGPAPVDIWHTKWGFQEKITIGRRYRRFDKLLYEWPSKSRYLMKRGGRVGARLLRERRVRADASSEC